MGIFTKIFGTHSDKELKRIQPIVARVEALEEEYKALTDDALRAKTPEFRARLQNGETLDDLLPEAFATVREASWRVLGLRHYPVQLEGGVVLHQGRIAEMKTGEGKTLVATLPAYLNALPGDGVHIVTVNDYLAKRDSEWMGKVYKFLGLTVGLIIHDVPPSERRKMYDADITYGTNNEFGFDYLRDNMVTYKQNMVQRGQNFAIVDEVDSILIDEARTPLIISGMGKEANAIYQAADKFVRTLTSLKKIEVDAKEEQDDLDCDYIIDEKASSATLTPRGAEKAEKYFKVENISDPENAELVHHINQAIKAHGVMHRDQNYIVREGKVVIVDEFTGRLMFGRRYNDGLHQAIEAKEGVKIESESKTLATITFQNFFRLYKKLSGMTGTALTEEQEFREIYALDVIETPTNRPMIREDHPDIVYKTEKGKLAAILNQIIACHEKGQPVLVGTVSVEKSELLSALLKRAKVPHQVLNAKFHEKEAVIVAQAGKRGAVTIATNMAGRGTDIMLGGNPDFLARAAMEKAGRLPEELDAATSFFETDDETVLALRAEYQKLLDDFKNEIRDEAAAVREAGGLFILGTERHESRRVDNQLRGRSGRQGDPGESRFFLSLEDDLMRVFGSDRVANLMNTIGLPEDEPIEARLLSNTIETAQRRVEGRNFETRKRVLEYDDVMNLQRELIYKERRQVLDGEDLSGKVWGMIEETTTEAAKRLFAEGHAADWDLDELRQTCIFLGKNEPHYDGEAKKRLTRNQLIADVLAIAKEKYEQREAEFGAPLMRELERMVVLKVVDTKWMDHIDAMDELRKEIGLRAYAQHNPVDEYKNEGFDMFESMIASIKEDTMKLIYAARIRRPDEVKREQVAVPTGESGGGDGSVKKQPVRTAGKKIGRNDPCPCGSGKKYKKCCGANLDE